MAQQAVDQTGLAVVNVGNDGDIAEIVAMHVVGDCRSRLKSGKKEYGETPAVGQRRLLEASVASVDRNDQRRISRCIPDQPVNTENRIVQFNLPDRTNRYL